ncbi:MAG TPA: diguanylate cyclase [Acidobacteriota bacterium]|nr:diguanylate cyclase [Acidobacteriota bacterium]
MNKRRILVVEDERLVAKHIENMVRGLGYEVAGVAATGEDAVRIALGILPDLVLMDIMLRGDMDGIAASEQIWDKAAIPIVYLTAYADEATLERAKVTDPFGYLLKPFEERELFTAIEMALYKHKTDRELKERERWLSTILTSIGDGVISTDRDGRVTFMNSVAEAMIGRMKEDCLGRGLGEVLLLVGEKTGRRVPVSVRKTSRKRDRLPDGQGLLLLRGEDKLPVEVGAALIRDEKDQVDGMVLVFRDVTQRKLQQERLAFLAIHDCLTGLPNRVLFNDHLTLALANAARRKNRKKEIVVLMLDLDRFKKVNDTLGHSVGDRLLKSVAERLAGLLRRSDTIARLGGDEFMILLPEISSPGSAARVARRILRAFKQPFDLKDRKIPITASIGIATYPRDGEDVESLTKNADIAMYAAKEGGRNTFKLHSPPDPGPEPGAAGRAG